MSGDVAASVPVITVDGPTASGKGTVAARVARELGYHYLDSGALYRLVALRALEEGIAETDADGLARLAERMQPRFLDGRVELGRRDVTQAIRTEEVSRAASRVAVHAPVRAALRAMQLSFCRPPGLVADGRDMGTVVFPSADLKVFLTASLEARAERRYKQLIEKGLTANMRDLLADLRVRDERDSTRAAAPLRPAEDAYRLDSSAMSIDEVVAQILAWYRDR
ncbi:MAG TPA: (d)CMP kinase [Burkholderiaceae bacterium]|nr:(d)CMP kinase [Burkholderiaceae bacterium]